jgi:choline dehydrogenase
LDADIWFPIVKPSQSHAFEGCACLMHPESRGEVTLASADPQRPPAIRFNCLATPGDLATLREGVRMIRRLYASGPVGEMISGETKPGASVESDAELDDYLRRSVELGHHPVGTCAMGVSDEAVVDPELKVRGLASLRVVDASIMPRVPGGHTTAPTLMLAEKAADMIRGRAAPEPAAA